VNDFRDLLRALLDAGVRFLVVGAHALAAHGVPRMTGDLDVWVEPTPDNAGGCGQPCGASAPPSKRWKFTSTTSQPRDARALDGHG
jgi:hypothetical protein